jgi:hypothetical protein
VKNQKYEHGWDMKVEIHILREKTHESLHLRQMGISTVRSQLQVLPVFESLFCLPKILNMVMV